MAVSMHLLGSSIAPTAGTTAAANDDQYDGTDEQTQGNHAPHQGSVLLLQLLLQRKKTVFLLI